MTRPCRRHPPTHRTSQRVRQGTRPWRTLRWMIRTMVRRTHPAMQRSTHRTAGPTRATPSTSPSRRCRQAARHCRPTSRRVRRDPPTTISRAIASTDRTRWVLSRSTCGMRARPGAAERRVPRTFGIATSSCFCKTPRAWSTGRSTRFSRRSRAGHGCTANRTRRTWRATGSIRSWDNPSVDGPKTSIRRSYSRHAGRRILSFARCTCPYLIDEAS